MIYRQNKHFSAHSLGISFWHCGHIKPFCLMAAHVWQKRLRISAFLSGSFTRKVTIWSISVEISVEPSIDSRFPLSLLMYLLTADCESPRTLAVSCSLSPCFSTICLAIIAFTAGKTVFTPTSHGSIKFCTHQSPLFFGGNYLNMSPVISYDACHDG